MLVRIFDATPEEIPKNAPARTSVGKWTPRYILEIPIPIAIRRNTGSKTGAYVPINNTITNAAAV
jgi:hypothetical protein